MAAKSFEDLYDQTSSGLLKQTGKESFEAVKMLQKTNIKNYTPANNAVYPNSALGNSLKQIAQLVKMDVGLEVAFAESNGWDTHFNQGTENGIFARNVADLSDSISALWCDLEAYQDDVTVMTMTAAIVPMIMVMVIGVILMVVVVRFAVIVGGHRCSSAPSAWSSR